MINYLIESSVCLVLFYLLYLILLRKENHFNAKRAYLMSATILSIIIPLFHFTYVIPTVLQFTNSSNDGVLTSVVSATTQSTVNVSSILLWLYAFGASIAIIKLTISLVKILKTIRKGVIIRQDNYNVVHTANDIPISSFFNYVFINDKDQWSSTEINAMLSHESIHIRDRHSIDVIVLEFAKILYWFNPVIYFLNDSLRAQHEFVCDQEVVKTLSPDAYEKILIRALFRQLDLSLLSPFNHLPIKKRIDMIYKKKPSKFRFFKFAATLPLLAFLIFTFSCEESTSDNVELESSLGMTKSVTGRILSAEDGRPLPGTNVVIKGARLGTVTDISGNYSLEVPKNYNELVFSFISFQSQTLTIGTKEVIDVEMIPDVSEKE